MDLTEFAGQLFTALMAFAGSYLALTNRMTKIETMIDVLSNRVEKHNNVMERTTKLETEVGNLYHRYDELRDDVKIGGTE